MRSRSQFVQRRIYRIFTVCVIVAVAWYVSKNLYQLMMISGDSMSPSYHNMQLVILDKYSKTYGYGDVIAFRCDGLDSILVKRIAACPGDTVIIHEGALHVNGDISAIYEDMNAFEYEGIAADLISLQENAYFVIGDNVAESKDSRYTEVGCVYKEDIIGRVLCQNKE